MFPLFPCFSMFPLFPCFSMFPLLRNRMFRLLWTTSLEYINTLYMVPSISDAILHAQEFYKRWLCATKLIFYNATSTSMGAGVGPARLRPCIGVCENVLQSCPYYLPSRFQSTNSTSQNESSSSIPQSVVYGGYPAFDCPSK